MYCGLVVLISQPLLPIGMNTPSCIALCPRHDVMNSFQRRVR
jgi:hypothetical protein